MIYRYSPLLILFTIFFIRGPLFAAIINSDEHRRNTAADISDTAWEITADKITRYTNPDRIMAEGNAILHPREETDLGLNILQADWIRYNRAEGKVEAQGNVVIKKEKKDLTAERASLDLKTQEAVFSEATLFIPKHQLHFTGRKITRKTDNIYYFQDGYYTTCPLKKGGNPPWHLNTDEGTLHLKGIGHLKNTVLRVKGIPIFYVPYLPLPLFKERKTGFLLPELSLSSRSGIGISTPYFLNLSPSSDISLYPGYLSRRGATIGAEFRYFADYESRTFLGFSYLNDRTKDSASDDYKSDGYLRNKENRYWLWGKMDHDFGNRTFARIDLDIVSDQDYLQEFETSIARFDDLDDDISDQIGRGFEEPSLPYRSSRFNLNRSWDSAFLGGQLIEIDDNNSPRASTDQINTLPHLIFSGSTPLPVIPTHLTWDTDYVNYWRDEGVGEERLDLYPRLISSLPLPAVLEGVVSTGFRETIYDIHSYGDTDWNFENRQFWTAWDVKSEIGTTLTRDFDVSAGSWDRFNHSLRPEAAYQYHRVNKDDPLPGLDRDDSLANINRFSYGLNNYFRAGGTDQEGEPFEKYLGAIKLSQFYNLKEARRDLNSPADERRPFSDISLQIDVYPLPRWALKFESDYSVYGEGVTSYDLYTKYSTARGDNFSVDYRYKQNSTINEINAAVETKLTNTLIIQGDIKQSLETNKTVSSSVSLIYHPQCWAFKFSMENTPDDERIAVVLSLVGLGDSLGIGLTDDLTDEGGLETTLEGNILGIGDKPQSTEE